MIEPVSPGMRYRFHDLTREYARQRAGRRVSDPAEHRAVPDMSTGRC